jgi:hypothetical protein
VQADLLCRILRNFQEMLGILVTNIDPNVSRLGRRMNRLDIFQTQSKVPLPTLASLIGRCKVLECLGPKVGDSDADLGLDDLGHFELFARLAFVGARDGEELCEGFVSETFDLYGSDCKALEFWKLRIEHAEHTVFVVNHSWDGLGSTILGPHGVVCDE